jgi:hypothetical protein
MNAVTAYYAFGLLRHPQNLRAGCGTSLEIVDLGNETENEDPFHNHVASN